MLMDTTWFLNGKNYFAVLQFHFHFSPSTVDLVSLRGIHNWAFLPNVNHFHKLVSVPEALTDTFLAADAFFMGVNMFGCGRSRWEVLV